MIIILNISGKSVRIYTEINHDKSRHNHVYNRIRKDDLLMVSVLNLAWTNLPPVAGNFLSEKIAKNNVTGSNQEEQNTRTFCDSVH